MTNVSRLGTTSARRKAPRGVRSRARAARALLARPASARATPSVSRSRCWMRDLLCSAKSVFRTAQRVALSCGPISLGKTSMLGTTAALREAKQGSEQGPQSSDARQLQCPSCAAVNALASRRPRLRRSPHLIVHRGGLRPQPASGSAQSPQNRLLGRLSSTTKPRAMTSASTSGRRSAERPEHAQPRAVQQSRIVRRQ